jgi:hypothetical protein
VPEIKTVQVLLFEVAVEIHAHPGDKVMILGDRVIGVDTSSEPAPVPVLEHSRHPRNEDEDSTYDYYIGMTREAYRERAVEIIKENPGITTTDILAEFGQSEKLHPGSRSRLYALLRKEVDDGIVRKTNDGPGRDVRWFTHDTPQRQLELAPKMSKEERMERALQFIRENPGSRPADIARGSGVADPADRRAYARFWWTLHDLTKEGKVTKEVQIAGPGSPGGLASFYTAVEQEQAA